MRVFCVKSNSALRRLAAVGLAAALIAGCARPAAAADAGKGGPAKETKEQRDKRMKWWREARFGMFIHWGVYSVPAGTWKGKRIGGIGEWIMNRARIPANEYERLAEKFNPVKFDADAWVRLAKDAGMKYIVITSKHHDGFAMYHSMASTYNIVDATPFDRDPLKELAAACKKRGVKLGFYYSHAQDWHHPGGAGNRWDTKMMRVSMEEYIRTKAAPQVRELLSNYGPIAIMWWDTPANMSRKRADMLRPLLKLQPGIISNNRLGGGYRGDFGTPEQHIPGTGTPGRDWETCMTMNGTWGYKSYDHGWKSTATLVRNLVDIASKGGNYLLNVGPTALGEIPQPSVKRLREMGAWIKVNGESVYATTASPFKRLLWGRCTKKLRGGGATLYLHVFHWPADGKLRVPGLRSKVAGAKLLATGQALKTSADDDDVEVDVPAKAPDPIDTVIVLDVAGKLEIVRSLIGPLIRQRPDGSAALPASEADVHGRRLRYERGVFNCLGFWFSPKDWAGWRFKIYKPGKFDVTALLSTPNVGGGGGTFEVTVGGEKLRATAPGSGGWRNFVEVKLGTLTIGKPGKYSLHVRPVAKGWKPINLRSVVLKPAR